MDNSVRFFSGKNIHIAPGSMGVLLKVTMPDGTVYEDVEPRRYFPISDIYKNISIVRVEEDERGKDKITEYLIIKDIANLDEESRKALLDSLNKYYMIPKIVESRLPRRPLLHRQALPRGDDPQRRRHLPRSHLRRSP